MVQTSLAEKCGCNDYSLLTANTGIATISTANPNLNGSGDTVVVVTGDNNGTIIKSIILKLTQATAEPGMVRLFIRNSGGAYALIREIPIAIYPNLITTPTPAPILPMLEIDLLNVIKLKSGDSLCAATQSSQAINVIAEGLNWRYPMVADVAGETGISTNSNFEQYTSLTEIGTVSTANPNLDGTGVVVSILTATANGTIIKSITITALSSTIEGMVRLFINNGVSYFLWMEIVIPPSTQSAFNPSFKVVLEEDFHLQEGYSIGAATHNSQSFAITIEGLSWSYPVS